MSQVSDYNSGLTTYLIQSKDFVVTTVEKEYVNLFRENLPNVYVYVENPEKQPRTPAIVLTLHNVQGRNFCLGNIVGQDSEGNDIFGFQWDFILSIDIWALDTKTRDDIISIIQTLVMTQKSIMRHRISQIDAIVNAAQERGFDLSDRIIQYASHQITRIYRQLLSINLSVVSTYKPIITAGWLESIIFTLGTNIYTVDNTLIEASETFGIPFDGAVGMREDEMSLLTNLVKINPLKNKKLRI